MRKVLFLVFLTLLLVPIFCINAQADIFDTYGFSARGIGMGNALCADAKDPSSIYYNPAGLGRVKGHAGGLAYLYTSPSMDVSTNYGSVSGVPKKADLAIGVYIVNLAVDINSIIDIPRQITFGIGLSLMDNLSFINLEDVEEHRYRYIQFGAPLKRSAIYMGLGAEIIPDWIWLGLGAHSMVTGTGVMNMTIEPEDLSTSEYVTPTEQDIWMDMELAISPTAGIIFSLWKKLNIGFSYKDAIDVDIDPFYANLDLTLGSNVVSIPVYTAILCNWNPTYYKAGISYRFSDIMIEFDIFREEWSDFKRSVPREWRRTAPKFEDIYTYRSGLEYVVSIFNIWGGYQYAPSPVPNQPLNSNYLDSSRHILSLGFEVKFDYPESIVKVPFLIGAAIQDQIIEKRTVQKLDGSSYTLKGNVMTYFISLRIKT